MDDICQRYQQFRNNYQYSKVRKQIIILRSCQMHQSESSQFQTPIKSIKFNTKLLYEQDDRSTAQKFYDLQQSYKQYQYLMEENLKLKNLLLKQQAQRQQPQRSNLQTKEIDDYLQQKYGRNKSSMARTLSSTAPNQFSRYQQFMRERNNVNDIVLWAKKERNQYLQEKVHNLKEQYIRQCNGIRKIQQSNKWKNRFDCTENSCYQHKYLQLLRVRSPVLLD